MNGTWYHLTDHAEQRLRQRKVLLEWVERTLEQPDYTEPDPHDPHLTRAYKRMHAAGDRLLRVVYNHTVTPIRVVTVFFETPQKGQKP